jgi:hypothetical protein
VKPTIVQKRTALMLTCDLDCAYVAQLYRLPGRLLGTRRGRATGGRAVKLALRVPAAPGRYRVRLSATARVNPGPAALLRVPVRRG